ncbi:MAG TPA: chromosomal replication initiator protein DnaA [Armatimonadota bacterium]|jgi:chromosomal replication initiator protein
MHELWQSALPLLAERLGQATCDSFLRPAIVLDFDGTNLTLGLPNEFARTWLREKYPNAVDNALSEMLHQPIHVQLEVAEQVRPVLEAVPSEPAPEEPVRLREGGPRGATPLNPKYTFANFVVADCNRFAHAAALQVARAPGSNYNPLFIHSKVGLGKTHLMQAIGHMVLAEHPSARVIYISAEDFVNHFITAMRDNSMARFRETFRNADVILVDDIQFIAAIEGPASEEEFFHTFNALYQTNKQLVIASDSPPRHLQIMNDRLRSRLEMGIVADLRPPEVEARVAILEKKSQTEGVHFSREILEFVAQKIISNIRVLEGALLKLCAHASLEPGPLTLAQVEEIIADYTPASSERRVTVREIAQFVAEQMDCDVEDMLGAKRSQEIVWPRQVAIYLCRELTDVSLAKIGEYFGGRDHSTVLHGYNKVSEMLADDERVLWLINDLKAGLQGD